MISMIRTLLKMRPFGFLLPLLIVGTLLIASSFSQVFPADTKAKPTDKDQRGTATQERPSQLKQVHKALKSMDTKIPAETSKAVRSTKEAFKKRFHTTQEGSKDRK